MAFALRSLLLLCGISALLTGVWSVATVPVPCCPTNWIRLEDRCFIYVDTARTFAAAEDACNQAGGNLASIRNPVENALAQQLVRNANGGNLVDVWIGLHDGIQEGNFVRTDGYNTKFFDFRTGQPDDFGTAGEDCVEIYAIGNWNDDQCTDSQDYLCSINLW